MTENRSRQLTLEDISDRLEYVVEMVERIEDTIDKKLDNINYNIECLESDIRSIQSSVDDISTGEVEATTEKIVAMLEYIINNNVQNKVLEQVGEVFDKCEAIHESDMDYLFTDLSNIYELLKKIHVIAEKKSIEENHAK